VASVEAGGRPCRFRLLQSPFKQVFAGPPSRCPCRVWWRTSRRTGRWEPSRRRAVVVGLRHLGYRCRRENGRPRTVRRCPPVGPRKLQAEVDLAAAVVELGHHHVGLIAAGLVTAERQRRQKKPSISSQPPPGSFSNPACRCEGPRDVVASAVVAARAGHLRRDLGRVRPPSAGGQQLEL